MKVQKQLILGLASNYDQCYVPIYFAQGKEKVPLLKTLVTNKCRNDCLYCVNRRGRSRSTPRMSYGEDELVHLVLRLRSLGLIKGVFLSSSIDVNADESSLRMIRTAEKLRKEKYGDYIHLRLMPGSSRDTIRRALNVSDRIGINVEASDPVVFNELCPEKDYKVDVLKRIRWLLEERKKYKGTSIDTQMVVGALDDNDEIILQMTERLYKAGLSRIYYSGFIPIPDTPLEKREPCDSSRIYRLYQASFLIRDYKFSADDFVLSGKKMPDRDPKLLVAEKKDIFPLDVEIASRKELMLVPGIGPTLANRVVSERPKSRSKLKKLGVPRRALAYVK